MEFWIFAGIAAFIIIMAEYARGKENAETREKIDEMHLWMRKCHPYKFNGFTDEEAKIIKDRLDNDLQV